MKQCPSCRAQAFVKETRQYVGYTYRRYECEQGHRYTTNEVQVFGPRAKVDVKKLLVAIKTAARVRFEE